MRINDHFAAFWGHNRGRGGPMSTPTNSSLLVVFCLPGTATPKVHKSLSSLLREQNRINKYRIWLTLNLILTKLLQRAQNWPTTHWPSSTRDRMRCDSAYQVISGVTILPRRPRNAAGRGQKGPMRQTLNFFPKKWCMFVSAAFLVCLPRMLGSTDEICRVLFPSNGRLSACGPWTVARSPASVGSFV